MSSNQRRNFNTPVRHRPRANLFGVNMGHLEAAALYPNILKLAMAIAYRCNNEQFSPQQARDARLPLPIPVPRLKDEYERKAQ